MSTQDENVAAVVGGGGRFVCAAVSSSVFNNNHDDGKSSSKSNSSQPTLSREDRLSLAADRLSEILSSESESESGAHQLVIVPPLVPAASAKELTDSIEPAVGGPTFAVLSSVAEKRGVYLGTTVMEAEARNLEVYSTFVLIGPDGQLAGKVRNECPLGREAALVDAAGGGGGGGRHILTTEYGNIAVGLGWENGTAVLIDELDEADDDVALIVQMDGPLPSTSSGKNASASTDQQVSEVFAGEYGCPVVSVTGRGATIAGAAIAEQDKEDIVVAASVSTRKPSIVVVGGSGDKEQPHAYNEPQQQRRSRWNPLLPEPSPFMTAPLSAATFFCRLRYVLSIRRRLAAARALGLQYDPSPLLSCYAAMFLLFVVMASFFLSERHEIYLGGNHVCESVKSLCHGLCVPFLVLQALVHGVSHAMHVYVLGDSSGRRHEQEIYHPSVGCLGMRVFLLVVGIVFGGLRKFRGFKKKCPWGYLASCLCIAAMITFAPAVWKSNIGLAGPLNSVETNGTTFAQYSEAIRSFAVPFITVQVLVNACTHALHAYVTGGDTSP